MSTFLMDYFKAPIFNNEEDKIKFVAELIKNTNNICVLTGAGMSTDSGIPDFRSKEGLYKKKPKDILSRKSFFYKTEETFKFMAEYFNMINKEPNQGHYILAEWEKKGKNITILTQNIDGLHKKAGNTKVIEIHGTMNTSTCQRCGKKYDTKDIIKEDGSLNYYCNCIEEHTRKNLIKPNIVLFDESIKHGKEAFTIAKRCDLMLILGTSLRVFPFADIPKGVKVTTPIIIINQDATMYDDDRQSIVFHDNISKTLSKINDYL